MKKVLLIGFVLAILLLAFPQGVMAAAPVPVIVSATYTSTTVFTAATNATAFPWTLTVGPNSNPYALEFGLETLDKWTVTGEDTSLNRGTIAHHDGCMTGSVAHLISYFEMDAGSGYSTFATPLVIKAGNANSIPHSQDWKADIRQYVLNTDYASSNGYEITLTFTCATSF
jgi:hypothetical protein